MTNAGGKPEGGGGRQFAPTLVLFFALSFALSWVMWWPLVAARLNGTEPPTWLHLLGSTGPCVAALLVAAIFRGASGVGDLLSMLSPRRVPLWAWVVSIGGPLLLFAAAAGAEWLAGNHVPVGRALTSDEYPYLGSAALVAAQIFFYGIGEELGWRGLALPVLLTRLRPLSASLLLTIPWAIWHLPLFITNPTYAQMGVAGVAGWVASLATGSVLMGWLFLASGRSVLAVALFHGLLDLAMVNPAIGFIGINAAGALVTFAGIAAAIVLYRRG